MESFASHQHLLGHTDVVRSPGKPAWEGIFPVLCFRDALPAWEASGPGSCPLAAMFDSISDTQSEHGLSLEKPQRLILSPRSIHAQPGYSQTQCSQGTAVSHR